MIHCEELRAYSSQDAIELGLLRPHLSPGAFDEPVDETHLRHIIESPDHTQLAVRLDDTQRIVGAATLSIVAGVLSGYKGHLEDFVTDPSAGIKGIGQLAWKHMEIWCLEHDVDLEFTSKPHRIEAHNFYRKQGAEIKETTVFKKSFR